MSGYSKAQGLRTTVGSRRFPGAMAGLLAAVLLSGCASPAEPQPRLPEGVRVEVVQNRTDYAAARMQIRVVNDADADVVVSEITYSDDRFAESATWSGDSTIRAGVTRDLPVPVPQAECPPEAEVGSGRVLIAFAVDGKKGSQSVDVTDPLEMVTRVTGEQCALAAVEAAADITLGESVEFRGSGSEEVALVPLSVTAHEDSAVTLDSLESTVLLQPEDGSENWNLDQLVAGGTTTRVVLPIVPARCDPHAVAEDKVGTRFPLTVTVDGVTSEITLTLPSETRAQVFDYIGRRCGWA